MSETWKMSTHPGPVTMPGEAHTKALNRIADALERLADAYLYCNAPEEEGEEARPGQSLSDVPASLSERAER